MYLVTHFTMSLLFYSSVAYINSITHSTIYSSVNGGAHICIMFTCLRQLSTFSFLVISLVNQLRNYYFN